MINVACGSCGKNYRLDPKIIKSENARFTCKNCGHLNPLDQYLSNQEPIIQSSNPQTDKVPLQQQTQDSAHPLIYRTTPVTASDSYSAASRDAIQVTWKNRLQIKVNAVLIPLIIVIMATFTIITYITEKQKMEEGLQNASKVAAKRLSVYLVEAFWSLDDDILRESLKSEMLDNNIYAINLIDRSGKVIYLGYKRDQNWKLAENTTAIEDLYIKADEAIMKDSNKIGSVEVYFSSEFVQEQFNQSMYKLIITALLLLIAVSLAAYVVLNRMILAPIARLTDIANKISIGNLDLEIPIESKDEIGVLADAFARMKVSMAFAIKQLRKR